MSGKGSKPRPMAVSDDEMQANWERVFGKHQSATPPVLHGQVEEEAGTTASQGSVVLDVRPAWESGCGNGR